MLFFFPPDSVVRNFLAFLILMQKNLNGLKKIFGWVRFGPKGLNRACEARETWRGGSGSREKNPIINQVGYGLRVLTHNSGLSMQKPDPNPTRCHF